MKNFEEMAESVFRRRDAYVIRQKRNRRMILGVASAVACVCLALVITFGTGMMGDPNTGVSVENPDHRQGTEFVPSGTAESIPTQEEQGFVIMLSNSSVSEETEMIRDLELPLYYYLLVDDIRGKSNEEINGVMRKQSDRFMELRKVWVTMGRGADFEITRHENVAIGNLSVGCFLIYLKDYTQVEKIEVSNSTDFGTLEIMVEHNTEYSNWKSGNHVTLYAEERPETYEGRPFVVKWKHGDGLIEALNSDPSKDLSDFYDSITFVISYQDGRTETNIVEIIFKSDGSIFAVHRENLATA